MGEFFSRARGGVSDGAPLRGAGAGARGFRGCVGGRRDPRAIGDQAFGLGRDRADVTPGDWWVSLRRGEGGAPLRGAGGACALCPGVRRRPTRPPAMSVQAFGLRDRADATPGYW